LVSVSVPVFGPWIFGWIVMRKKDLNTILKVAEIAGVSRQNVSRVMKDHPDVADVPREHVQKVIDELG